MFRSHDLKDGDGSKKALSAVLLALFIAGCNATAGTGSGADFGTVRKVSTSPYQGGGSRDAEFALLGKTFSLSRLISARLGANLDVSDAGGLDSAAHAAIAGRIRADHDWSTSQTGNSGQVSLLRRDNRGSQECAILHHGHVFAGARVRGSLTACRRPDGPWILDDARWTRSGDDFAEPSRNQPPPKGKWRAVTE